MASFRETVDRQDSYLVRKNSSWLEIKLLKSETKQAVWRDVLEEDGHMQVVDAQQLLVLVAHNAAKHV